MFTADTIRSRIEQALTEKGIVLVDIQVYATRKVSVYVDTLQGITLEACAEVSRMIEPILSPEITDLELEVSSPGIGNPLKLPFQYKKNLGKWLRVVDTDGVTREGKIRDADDEKIMLEMPARSSRKDRKKEAPGSETVLFYTGIKTAKVIIR